MVSGGGAFRSCSGHEGGALMHGICALEEKNTGNKESQMVEGKDLGTETEIVSTLEGGGESTSSARARPQGQLRPGEVSWVSS